MTHRTQAVFYSNTTAMGCSSKSTHTGLARGRHMAGGVRRSPREGFPSSPSWGGGPVQSTLLPSEVKCSNEVHCFCPEKPAGDSEPRVFMWCGHSACTTIHDYRNSKLLQGKQAGVHYKSRCLYSLGKLVQQDSVPRGRYLSLISYKSRRCSKSQSSDASPGPPP